MTDFTATRSAFHLLPDSSYFDGGSLGPLPKQASARLQSFLSVNCLEEYGHFHDSYHWHQLAQTTSERLARLIGVNAHELLIGEKLTVQVFQAISAALSLCSGPRRRIILTDCSIAQSDLLAMQALVTALDCQLRVVEAEDICYSLSEDVAVLFMAEVDARNGKRRDMACLSRLAHDSGALTVWDLSHSAGTLKVDLVRNCADFAVGSCHGFLSGGPSAPAYLWISGRLASRVTPALRGWIGQHWLCNPLRPPATSGPMDDFRLGMPPLLGLAVLDAALEIWDDIPLDVIEARSHELTAAFLQGLSVECPEITVLTPQKANQRASYICLRHHAASGVAEGLKQANISINFCPPDLLRLSFCPLYNNLLDVERAIKALGRIARTQLRNGG